MRVLLGTTPAPALLAVAALLVVLAVALVLASASAAGTAADGRAASGDVVSEANAQAAAAAQVSQGAAAYAFACAVCHGASGLGFSEAVAAFPTDYQQCTRCHQPQNAPQMPGSQVGLSVMAFSLGDPPPLADAARLARFGTAAGLFHYLRATMPRWAPGSLDDETYLDVTAHLLRLVGLLADEEALVAGQLEGHRLE